MRTNESNMARNRKYVENVELWNFLCENIKNARIFPVRPNIKVGMKKWSMIFDEMDDKFWCLSIIFFLLIFINRAWNLFLIDYEKKNLNQ